MARHRLSPTGRLVAVALVAGFAAATVLGACTRDADTLDTTATERAVARSIGRRVTVDVEEIRCPSVIPRGEGRSVTCTAVLVDGLGTLRLRVTQRGQGQALDVELRDAVVDPADVARQLHEALVARYGRSFTVDCGPAGPAVRAPQATVRCKADDGATGRTITATVVDAAGTLSFDLGTAGS